MSKRKWKKILRISCLLLILISSTFIVFSQSAGDYRSVGTGNWTTLTTWQRFNGSGNWVTPSAGQGYPKATTSGVITIRSPHTVTVNAASIDVDQLVINSGATLNFTTAIPLVTLTVVDGAGLDLTNNGTIIITDDPASDSRLIVYGQMENNNKITIEVDCHLEVFGTLINNDTITTNQSGAYTGRVYVYGGATLQCAPSSVIRGGGNFYMSPGATIEVGSPLGINTMGTNTGNIQTTYERFFSEEAYYEYNGTANQITGTALTKAASVIISNTTGIVTFSRAVSMNYLIIEIDAKVNLNTFTHTAGALILPEGSYATGTWGSTTSPATNTNNIYFDVAASGIVNLSNQVFYIYVYSGSTSFITCPTDSAFKAIVEVWGAGGRGSTRTSSGSGGGGGGGAYSRDTVTITPGNNYTLSVGLGSSTTSAGEDSWVGTTANVSSALVLAKGGNSVGNTTNGATGGLASAGIGAVKYNGGAGASASGTYGGGGGSSAGINANGNTPNTTPSGDRFLGAIAPLGGGDGGNAKFGNSGPGNPGKTPGGGGGGAFGASSGTILGGSGADGKIRISYIPTFPTITFVNNNLVVCRGTTAKSLVYSATTGCPDLYRITFNAAAISVGFQNVSYTTLPADSISIVIPSSAPGGIYQGFFTIKSGFKGFSRSYPFTIRVNDPTFTTEMIPVTCYGESDGKIAITMTSLDNSPYTFSINNGTNYSATFSGSYPSYLLVNLLANTYKVRIKDKTGCVSASCP